MRLAPLHFIIQLKKIQLISATESERLVSFSVPSTSPNKKAFLQGRESQVSVHLQLINCWVHALSARIKRVHFAAETREARVTNSTAAGN
jgi:hypothetical protein